MATRDGVARSGGALPGRFRPGGILVLGGDSLKDILGLDSNSRKDILVLDSNSLKDILVLDSNSLKDILVLDSNSPEVSRRVEAKTSAGHNYIGHTCIGHNCIGHNYIGRSAGSDRRRHDDLSVVVRRSHARRRQVSHGLYSYDPI